MVWPAFRGAPDCDMQLSSANPNNVEGFFVDRAVQCIGEHIYGAQERAEAEKQIKAEHEKLQKLRERSHAPHIPPGSGHEALEKLQDKRDAELSKRLQGRKGFRVGDRVGGT